MKYAIMIYDYADEEQTFLGVKEKAEVKSTIEKCVKEYVEKDPEIAEHLGDIDVFIMAEDFDGNIKYINKASILNDFFNSNEKACYFSLDDICLINKVTIEL